MDCVVEGGWGRLESHGVWVRRRNGICLLRCSVGGSVGVLRILRRLGGVRSLLPLTVQTDFVYSIRVHHVAIGELIGAKPLVV